MTESELGSAHQAFEPAPFSKENEAMVLDALQQALSGMFYGYLTSIEEDEAAISSADGAGAHNKELWLHSTMAAQLRLGEKRILREGLEAVAVRQQQLSADDE